MSWTGHEIPRLGTTMFSIIAKLIRHALFEKRARALMTMLGIALGVAAAVAVGVVRDSMEGAFVSLIDELAGEATLQVGGDNVPVPEELLELTRAVPGVARATASITMMARLVDAPEAGFLIAGVDVLDEQTAAAFRLQSDGGGASSLGDLDPVVFLNSTKSLLVSEKLAARHGLKIDQEVRVLLPGGIRTLQIRGLLTDAGPAKIFGGNYGLMYLDAAQLLFARGDTFDRIDVVTQADRPVEQVLAAVRAAVGDRAKVERPERRGARMEQFLATLNIGMLLLSLMALFVGMFLVFNTVSTAVAERRRDIGVLRALGLSRGAVIGWFTLETALLGAAGGLLGVPLGVGLGKLALAVMEQQVQIVLPLSLENLYTTPSVLAAAWLAGIAAAVCAAVPPAWSAALVSPREAVERGRYDTMARPPSRALALAGLLLLGVALLAARLGRSDSTWAYGGLVALLFALVALVPAISLAMSQALGRVVPKLLGIHGRLACDHLQRARGLTAVTVAALAVGMCLAMTSASVTHSFKRSAASLLDQNLPADLFIHGGSRYIGNQNTQMPATLAAEVRAIEGVSGASAIRLLPYYLYRDKPVALIAMTAATHLSYSTMPLVAGNRERMYEAMSRGLGVLVSENFASNFQHRLGDQVQLDTPTGALSLPIAGIYTDYLSPNGTIVVDQALYAARFRDPLIDSIDVFVQSPSEIDRVRDDIAKRLGDRALFLILKNHEIRADLMQVVDQTFVLVYAQELIAILVAVLGILNALLVAVMERTRELGVLRAQGLSRRELVWVVLLEAGLIGVMGAFVGAVFGFAMGYHQVTVLIPRQTGWVLEFSWAWAPALGVGTLCTLAALVAGFYPARRAARMSITEALSYE